MLIRTNRFGISGESMSRHDMDDFSIEQLREAEMWPGRFFCGHPFSGRFICIDKLLLSVLEKFLMDTIDHRLAYTVDYVLSEFQAEFTRYNPGMIFYEKIYPEVKPIVFKRVKKLSHQFQSVYVGPRQHDWEIHLDVRAEHA